MRILEELVDYILNNIKPYPGNIEVAETYSYLVRLIKRFDKENNNGWILCKERLPKYEDTYYCTVKVKDGIKGMQAGAITGMECVYLSGIWKNVWFQEISHIFEVIAWQALPETYKENDTNE